MTENYSIIYKDDVLALSPTYDLLHTTIVLSPAGEELALPLNGTMNNLKQRDLVDYFGRNRLQLTDRVVNKVLMALQQLRQPWEALLEVSFLSDMMGKNI